MTTSLWYFAYGSNMSRDIFVERRKIQPSASTWGWLEGWRLSFDLPIGPGERGVANVVPEDGGRTCGVLHQITLAEAEHLDHTEGVHNGLYERIEVDIATRDGETVRAFFYHSKFSTTGRKPSPRYIGLLLDGAREHGLPAEYVDYLEAFERAVDEREADAD